MKQIKIYAEYLDETTLKQFNKAMELECNIQGALMPDAHAGYTLPIGAVVKSKSVVFPAYVGYDIGCGMCAVKLDIPKDEAPKAYKNIFGVMELQKDLVEVVDHVKPFLNIKG